MNRILGALGLVLSLSAAAAACQCTPVTPPCDQERLRAVAEVLEQEASIPGVEAGAIRGIAAACPGLNPGHVATFLFRYDPAFSRDRASRRSSSMPEWSEAFRAENWAACADVDAYARAATLRYSERAPLFYQACGVARFGVLDEGERFLSDDKDTFWLLAALERQGADRGLLRRLGRALMNSTATLPTALRRCNAIDVDDDACRRLVALSGVDVPSPAAESYTPWGGDLRLFITPRAVLWDGDVIARIDGGAIVPSDVVHHRIPALTPILEAWAKDPPRYIDAEYESRSRLLIAADRRLPIGVVHDVLHTVARAGVAHYALVVDDGGRLGAASVQRPRERTWAVGPVLVDEGGVHALLPSGETKNVAIDDDGAILGIAAELRRSYADDVAVLVRTTPTVSVDQVLRVVTASGGPGHRRLLYEDRFTGIVLGQEPPIPPRPGRWDDLEVRVATVEIDPLAPRSVTEASLRAQIEPRLGDLAECLQGEDRMRTVMPERLWVRVRAEDDGISAEFECDDPDLSPYALPSCAYVALGLRPSWDRIVGGATVVRLDLIVAVTDG